MVGANSVGTLVTCDFTIFEGINDDLLVGDVDIVRLHPYCGHTCHGVVLGDFTVAHMSVPLQIECRT